MVRLKGTNGQLVNICTYEFQFQYGAIERGLVDKSVKSFIQFQFQYGAIER